MICPGRPSIYRLNIKIAFLAGSIACAFASAFVPDLVCAQDAVVVQSEDATTARPAAVPNAAPSQPGVPPNVPPGAQPGAPPGATPPNGQPAGEGTPDANKPVVRSATPPAPPDKKEFNITPDADGRIQFNFRNQPWQDLLRWLSEASNMSLDWQELPGDYVNIATTRPFTLVETRDLVNRLLLLRGYTILEIDDVLMVVKTSAVNPSLVPHVPASELNSLPPNRFVRTSFSLNSLLADEIAEELKSLMSSNGKLTSLSATNRLEAMDAAGVLAEINRLLIDEQSNLAISQLAREFPLQYVRAVEVKDQLETFLGQRKSATPNASDPMQMQMMQQQMQQQMQQMQQQMQQQGGAGAKTRKPGEVFLVANTRQNSVIVHAPPDKMALVESFVKRIDVPSNSADSVQTLQSRMKTYRLASLDPKQLVAALMELDALEPTTRLVVDEDNKAVIAYASLADQYAISKLVERLDGSARQFDVVQLRRLDAEEVAGTVRFLMGVEKEEKSDDNDRFAYYYYGRSQNEKKKGNTDTFRVGANSRDNQLLVWANENEREEVNKLLIKLGEIPPAGGFKSTVRVIEASKSAETLKYLQELQAEWSQMSDTPLILPAEGEFRDAEFQPGVTPEPETEEEPESAEPERPSSTTTTKAEEELNKKITDKVGTERFVAAPNGENEPQSDTSAETPEDSSSPTIRPPQSKKNVAAQPDSAVPSIAIRLDENGNLLLSSKDTAALDQLEEMMLRRAPPKRPYVVFTIKNTRASWIVLNLKDYFKDVDNSEQNDSRTRYYFYDYAPKDDKKDDAQLSKKREVRFVYDNDTNTVIVRNASEQQLKLIEELIQLWDTPTKVSDRDLRYTKLVKVNYSKAEAIVDAIKDAYRDLLSSNDKAFQGPNGGKAGGEQKRDDEEEVVRNGAVNFAFEGKLSLGVDRVTNSVLVSAQGKSLLELIVKMVEQLDEAAKPSGSMSVAQLPINSSGSMQKALQAMLNAAPQTNNQQPNPNGEAANPNGGNPNGGGNGGGRRGGRGPGNN